MKVASLPRRPDSFLEIFCPLQRAECHQHQQRSHHWLCLCVHKHVSDHDQYSSKSIGSDYNMILPSSDGCLHVACNNVNSNLEVSFKLQPDSFSYDRINSGLHYTLYINLEASLPFKFSSVPYNNFNLIVSPQINSYYHAPYITTSFFSSNSVPYFNCC